MGVAGGAFHLFEGWVLFVVALGLLVMFHRLLRHRLLTCAAQFTGRYRAVTVRERSLPLAANHRVVVLMGLLLFQGVAFYGLARRAETIPASKPLAEFPAVIGDWRMVREGAVEQDEKDVLRADDYLTRQYAAAPDKTASLFVAYFRSQRAGQTPHSPKNCLPASGWSWSVADTIRVDIAGRAQPIEINRYIVSKGNDHAVVLYWYQSRDRVVASEYRAVAFTAWDALRYNRTDTELVRVVTPVTQNGVEFIQAFFTELRRYNQ